MKEKAALAAALLLSALFAGTANAEEKAKKEAIVTFKNKINEKAITDNGGFVTRKFPEINAALIEIPTSSLTGVKAEPSVARVEENQTIRMAPPAKGFEKEAAKEIEAQGAGENDFWNDRIGLPKDRKNYAHAGKGIKVAVIDTGVESGNPNLNVAEKLSFIGEEPSPDDEVGHGTGVAELIASKGVKGPPGVAPEVAIYSLKALGNKNNPSEKASGKMSDIISAVEWCATHDIDVVNMSFGSFNYSYAFEQAISKAYEKGEIIVAAAGNEGSSFSGTDTVIYPAKYKNAIAVSALNFRNNTTAEFSSSGEKVELSAPGASIGMYYKGRFDYSNGTSFASPLVAGAAAIYKELHPDWTSEQIRVAMDKDAVNLSDGKRSGYTGFGIVQVPTKSKNVQLLDLDTPLMEENGAFSGKSLGPDTVAVFDKTEAGYRVKTEDGDRWIKPKTSFELPLPSISKDVEIKSGDQALTRIPADIVVGVPIAPQTVRAYEQWVNGNETWYHVKAKEGDGWFQAAESRPAVQKQTFIVQETRLHASPCDDCATWGALTPQEIKPLDEKSGWLKVDTWMGEQWIKKSDTVNQDNIAAETKTVQLTKITQLKKSPAEDAWTWASLSPQAVKPFEKFEEWLHVRTWIGDMWIKP